jgi:UDP-N-acetylmuramate dehydrogenase
MIRSQSTILLQENVPLAPYTTLAVGGPARYLVHVADELQAIEALEIAYARSLPVFILGRGSNVLIADSGFPGLVLRMELRGIECPDKETSEIISVAAGEEWDSFISLCVEKNLAGLECLSGIPGSAGATPVQNVGAYGEEVGNAIVSVRALERETLTISEISSAQCHFAYRSSIFNTSHKGKHVVLRVTFALIPGGRATISYPDIKRYFSAYKGHPPLAEVREAVLSTRAAKAMMLKSGDPDCQSAGSFFKNPIVSEERCLEIEETARIAAGIAAIDAMPRYKISDGQAKISAAWLVERSGFSRGYRRGSVGLSSRHALALVNRGGASAQEIAAFAREIQTRVQETFGIVLETEPEYVGF